MSNTVIVVENISKSYRLGQIGTGTLTNDLKVWWAKKHGKPNPLLKIGQKDHGNRDGETVWALKDVSFKVEQGEVLGVIGRNGAGKSTLLKILSRVTAPTTGEVKVKGRIASLLEVGTGFHPDLTGRENIYLNGAILGMSKQEVNRKFDEIVDFAEVEKFIDTPVKRYSSGMYVRLAFAVAAHMEPEILLVDEVLAVGDANFQKKCLRKIGDVSGEGRTVLFVSHNIQTIQRICRRVVLLNSGRLVSDGDAVKVTSDYLRIGSASPGERYWSFEKSPGDHVARLKSVYASNSRGEILSNFGVQEKICLNIEYWSMQDKLKATAILHLINDEGITLFASNDWNNKEWWNSKRKPGVVHATCEIPPNFLAEGHFSVLAAVGSYNPNIVHAIERDAISLQVIDQTTGDGVRGVAEGHVWPGVIRPMLKWHIKFKPNE